MVIENRGNDVKVTQLTIKKLYGRYDYDVKFDNDLTFLFGANGSGKTTILDILSSVITGELYRLGNYEFEEIVLSYSDEKSATNKIEISPSQDNGINFIFNGKNYTHKYVERDRDTSVQSHLIEYFRLNPILEEIQNLFPFIYLPLNRKSGRSLYPLRHRVSRTVRYTYGDYNDRFVFDTDRALDEAQNIVTGTWRGVSQRKQKLDRDFRDNLFKSLITMQEKDIIEELNALDLKKFSNLLKDYVHAVKNMDVLNEDEFTKFSDNNKKLEKSIEHSLSKDRDKNKYSFDIRVLVNFYRIWQANEIVELTKNLQKDIESEEKSLNAFLITMNDFFGDGEDAVTNKRLLWSDGNLVFRCSGSDEDIELSNLSSGEKQLFIFFAHLIFSLEGKKSGILVVDEPELSLHLAWQREYVNKIRDLNKNVQMIFATHAPEIIGQHSDKMVKLAPVLSQFERGIE